MTQPESDPPLSWLSRVATRYLLPVWFAIFSTYYAVYILTVHHTAGLDARIYSRAAKVWLAGGDPWSAAVYVPEVGRSYHFAGLPPTVLVFAPFAWLPESIIQWGWVAGSIAAGAWIIRRLGLPWWWLLFPPLVQGELSGNPGIVLLALLLTRWPCAEGVAAALKVYALLPMLVARRWWGITVFGGLCLLSLPLWLAWDPFATTGRLVQEASGGTGASAYWWLFLPTILAVAVIARLDLLTASWLAIPALWPSSQFHYGVMALPVIRLWPAALLAVPIYGMPAVAIILYGWLLVRDHRLRSEQHRREVVDGAGSGAGA